MSTKSSEIQITIFRLPQKLILKSLRTSKIILYDSSQSTQLDKSLTSLPFSLTYHWISIFDPKSSQDLFQSSQSSSGSLILNKSFSLKSLWSQGQQRVISPSKRHFRDNEAWSYWRLPHIHVPINHLKSNNFAFCQNSRVKIKPTKLEVVKILSEES